MSTEALKTVIELVWSRQCVQLHAPYQFLWLTLVILNYLLRCLFLFLLTKVSYGGAYSL